MEVHVMIMWFMVFITVLQAVTGNNGHDKNETRTVIDREKLDYWF